MNNILDPIQGFDVEVSMSSAGPGPGEASSQMLVGRFTSILVRVVNVTETYLELNERIPRHLDGEVNIVWQCERGMLNTQVLQDTFGFFSPAGSDLPGGSISRGNKVIRAKRFRITFRVSVKNEDFADTNMASHHGQISGSNAKALPQQYTLEYCKVDTMSFGATSGRNIVANQWQGTAEGITIS